MVSVDIIEIMKVPADDDENNCRLIVDSQAWPGAFFTRVRDSSLRCRLPPGRRDRLIALILLAAAPLLCAQLQRRVSTAKGETADVPVPHPLSYWTDDPLRLDATGDLMLGYKARDGKPIVTSEYRVDQQVTHLGVINGFGILQVLTTIHAGPHVIASGWATEQPQQWKSLLVKDVHGAEYIEIYELQTDYGNYEPIKPAKIYGKGRDAILGTYDPDSGNGGGCDDGYWWFDKTGAHTVDFSPLEHAIGKVLPDKSSYTESCWAMHPDQAELKSWVQKADAECLGCGGLGEIDARYKIEHGAAIPVSVHFEPEQE